MPLGFRSTAFALVLALAPAAAFAQTATSHPTMTAPGATTSPSGTGMTGGTAAPHMPATSAGAPSATASSGGPTHYTSQSDAQSACSGDTVVWASPRSKALHTSDSRYFGKSKHGFYACEKQAMASGYHLAGTGGHHHHKATT